MDRSIGGKRLLGYAFVIGILNCLAACHDARFDNRTAIGIELLGSSRYGPEDPSDFAVERATGTAGGQNINFTINDEVLDAWSTIPKDTTDHRSAGNTITIIEDLPVDLVNDEILDDADRNVTVDHVKGGDKGLESEAVVYASTGPPPPPAQTTSLSTPSTAPPETTHPTPPTPSPTTPLPTPSTAPPETTLPTPPQAPPVSIPTVIFDTDLGPDIDDALALAMLHAYTSQGDANLAAVTVSRNSVHGARYADLVNTFYGRPDLPIGIYYGSTPLDSHDTNWSRPVAESGRYPHDIHLGDLRSAATVMRQVLAEAPDDSVLLVQTGLSVNTAELLASGPDEISPLSGLELVTKKVKLLSIMAGHNGYRGSEFNIKHHIESAAAVFRDWPTEIIQTEGPLGHEILYPLSSIENDFEYVADHPVKEAYLTTDLSWHDDQGDSYNMRSWDLHSVLAAVEPVEDYYRLRQRGRVDVDDEGRTVFTAAVDSNLRSLGSKWDYSDDQIQAIVDRMIETVTRPPDQLP